MNKAMATALFTVVFLLAASVRVLSFEGPLLIRNTFPLFLPAHAPAMESASVEDSFSAGISHASVFMTRHSDTWTLDLDMEVTVLHLLLRKKIGNSFELGVEVPVVSHTSGFMDGFLDAYHRAFGLPDYGRSEREENSFLFSVQREGASVVEGRNGRIGIGDIRLTAKKILSDSDPVVSLKAEVELPTGQASRGYGNGSIDGAAALLIDKKIGEKFLAFLNLGAVFPGDLKGGETVPLRNFLYGGAGMEVILGKDFSLIGQILFQSSPLPETDIGNVDRVSALLSFGGRYTSGKNSIEFSLTEDPNTAGAPDVAMNLSYKRRL